MYACLHLPAPQASPEHLMLLAKQFSPLVEQTAPETVVFFIQPLRKFIGSPSQIASEISRLGHEHKLEANLAIASNPDAAILLARHYRGVTLASPGEERGKLALIPLTSLCIDDVAVDSNLFNLLNRWGLKSCEDLAGIPEEGLAERLGPAGIYLRKLACGTIHRPLRVAALIDLYEVKINLEYPLHLLDPLLFSFSRTLANLCERLRSQSLAARLLEVDLHCEEHKIYRCALEFPVPLDESAALLKLLQLHLERHPPEAAVLGFRLRIEPVEPRRVQGGLFLPPTPMADKLQVTLARIAGMVGKENVGTPRLLNTHRPDAFEMTALNLAAPEPVSDAPSEQSGTLKLIMRLFRPALPARVKIAGAAPQNVIASGVKGTVLRSAGPWKTSGEWWTSTAWNHEEWDVALDDGALYRIYQEMRTHDWYVHAVYD